MRLFKLIVLLTTAFPLFGALARVNNTSGWDFSGVGFSDSTTLAHVPATIAVSSGNLIVIITRFAAATSVTTVTDTAGNTYNQVGTCLTFIGTNECMFYATNVIANASDQLVVHWAAGGGASFLSIVGQQYTGELITSSSFDTSATGTATASPSVTSGVFTTTQANGVTVCGATYADTTVTAGTAGGAAMSIAAFDSPNKIIAMEDIFTTAIQTGITASMNSGSNQNWLLICSSYKSAVTATPPAISKSFGVPFVYNGSGTSLSFAINNPNLATSLTSVGFTDTLPSGLIVATPNGLSGTCGGGTITAIAGSGSISLASATLTSSASCNFSVNVLSTSIGTKNNVSGAVTSIEGGAGNTASASLLVSSTTPTMPTVRSGNWSDISTVTSPWCTSSGTCALALVGHGVGGVPGNNDLVNIVTTHALACDMTPCIYGTSAASSVASPGAVEMTIGAASSLTINASKSILARGNIAVSGSDASSYLIFGGSGAAFTFDGTLSSGGTAIYSIRDVSAAAIRKLTANCGDAWPPSCTINSTPSGAYIDGTIHSFGLAHYDVHGLAATNMGTATQPAFNLGISASDPTFSNIVVKYSSLINPGAFVMTAVPASGVTLTIDYVKESGSLYDPYGYGYVDTLVGMSLRYGGGATCNITHSHFADMVSPAQVSGCNVNDSVFRRNIDTSSFTVSSVPIADFSRNFVSQPVGTISPGTILNTFFTTQTANDNIMQAYTVDNPHLLRMFSVSGTPQALRNICVPDQWIVTDPGECLILNLGVVGNTSAWLASGTLSLPDFRLAASTANQSWDGFTDGRTDTITQNNVSMFGSAQAPFYVENGGNTVAAGKLTSEKYALVFNNGATEVGVVWHGSYLLWQTFCNASAPIMATAIAVDYNYINTPGVTSCASFTNHSLFYDAQSPGALGTVAGYGFHDVHNFLPKVPSGFDQTNRYSGPMTFDVDYLGSAVAVTGNVTTCTTAVPCDWSAFAAGYVFSIGQVVSFSASNMYGGRPINLIVTQSHTKSTITPGTTGQGPDSGGNQWWWFWDSNAYAQWLPNQLNGAIYVDGSLACTQGSPCTAQQVMQKWTRRRWMLQNRSGCAVNGANDVGAIACDPVYAGVVGQ